MATRFFSAALTTGMTGGIERAAWAEPIVPRRRKQRANRSRYSVAASTRTTVWSFTSLLVERMAKRNGMSASSAGLRRELRAILSKLRSVFSLS